MTSKYLLEGTWHKKHNKKMIQSQRAYLWCEERQTSWWCGSSESRRDTCSRRGPPPPPARWSDWPAAARLSRSAERWHGSVRRYHCWESGSHWPATSPSGCQWCRWARGRRCPGTRRSAEWRRRGKAASGCRAAPLARQSLTWFRQRLTREKASNGKRGKKVEH